MVPDQRGAVRDILILLHSHDLMVQLVFLTVCVFSLLSCPTPGCDGSGHVSGKYARHRRYERRPVISNIDFSLRAFSGTDPVQHWLLLHDAALVVTPDCSHSVEQTEQDVV